MVRNYSIIHNIFLLFCRIFPNARKWLWKILYQLLISVCKKNEWSFMNYGYASYESESKPLKLQKKDEPNRFFIQLYHHVVKTINMEGLDVLEIGSGRGGGADFVSRYLMPKSITGVDISKKAVVFCNKYYSSDKLSFVNGDSEALPFANESFSAVINVESSHCYGSMETFLSEVSRVLKKGGYFLFADLRDDDEVALLNSQLQNTRLKLIKHEDITDNIIHALHLDSQNRMERFKKVIPSFILESFKEFAGTKMSRIYKRFAAKTTLYLHYVMQKT